MGGECGTTALQWPPPGIVVLYVICTAQEKTWLPKVTFSNFQENVASSIQCRVLTLDPDNLGMELAIGTDIEIQSSSSDISTGDKDSDTGSVLGTFSTSRALKRLHNGKNIVCHVICGGKELVSSEPQQVNVLCKCYF